MKRYRLTTDAHEDLRQIVRYTDQTWGRAQVYRYRDRLAQCLDTIARGEVIRRRFHPRLPELYVHRCEKHAIFYIEGPSAREVSIIAILHCQMDLLRHLRSRLG